MKFRLIYLSFLLTLISAFTLSEEVFASSDPLGLLKANIPTGWKIKETQEGQIPWGHYWGSEYSGPTGCLILLEGPADVNFHWQDSGGKWHAEPIAKEALELWIMPPGYRDSWKRFFKPHRPIPAKKILSNKKLVLYGQPTHRIILEQNFKSLLKQATSTGWPESPYNGGTLSWSTWDKDLGRVFEKNN